MKSLMLSDGWQCKQRAVMMPLADDFAQDADWLPARVPGNIHLDLMTAGHIPDPFVGLQENEVQWVGESDWLYRCIFELPADFDRGTSSTTELCFAGLDTFATAWFNGTQILVGDNMFVPYRVPVGALLRPGRNELFLLFESALREGRLRKEKAAESLPLWNGDPGRLYVRKAQYHYGWDWGPTLLTAGPWRPVHLENYTARIADLHCPTEVAADLQSATFPVHILLEAASSSIDRKARLALYSPDGKVIVNVTQAVDGDTLEHVFTLDAPQLWWPRGYGEQPLYRLEATLLHDDVVEDRCELRLGLRRLRLVQEPLVDEPGTSFFFELNNTPIFCGGVNWIPADSFIPRITPERYRAWLQLAADANLVMIRVWGGGIYEEDCFYDICDELGLLVWQDFLFACGIYPAPNWFQQSVRAEAEANVRRLRHHPSLVIWAGNNEDYAIAEVEHRYDPSFEGDFTTTAFPARAIYERLLPEICATLDPQRPYWPGSPYGGAGADDMEHGDMHVWTVWHGAMAPYQDYYKYSPRFISEFGMQAFPEIATIATFAEPEEFYPQSRVLDHHNKAADGPRRLASYVIDNVRLNTELEAYIYQTQFVQSEALISAVSSWRRRWRGPGREYTAGALVWQLNDCWPVTSWAIADYALRPKAAYFTLKRELAPFVVGMKRQSTEQVEIWAVNGLTTPLSAELELRTWSLDGRMLAEEHRHIELAANQATELGTLGCPQDDTRVVSARLLKDGVVLARRALWPEPFKYLTLPDPAITLEHIDAETLRVSAAKPAKGVQLSAGDGITWSDNMLDLFPDDAQTIIVRGSGEKKIQIRCLS